MTNVCQVVHELNPVCEVPSADVLVAREAVIMWLFREYALGFDGWRILAGRYPNRVQLGRSESERRVYLLLSSLTAGELAAEFCSNLGLPVPQRQSVDPASDQADAREAPAGITVPRNALICALSNDMRRYGTRRSWRKSFLVRSGSQEITGVCEVDARLRTLSEERLATEFCRSVRPTTAYLQAAGVPEDTALKIHFGEALSPKVLGEIARRGILPAQITNLALLWWPEKSHLLVG